MWRSLGLLVFLTAAVYGGIIGQDDENPPNEIDVNREAGDFQLRSLDCCKPIDHTQCKNQCGVGFSHDYKDGCGYVSCKCVRNHEGIFEGDMKVAESNRPLVNHLYGIYEEDAEQQVRGLSNQARMFWPRTGNTVNIPYVMEGSVDGTTKSAINRAIAEYTSATCIRLIPRNGERDYISFFKGQGCWSYIGKNGGKQQISIGRGCAHVGIILHEVMHALGFFHEQSRPDRDSYVRINKENIRSGMEGNFQKTPNIDSRGSPYDYGSVMHYGKRAFSKNSGDTITPLRANVEIGQRRGFSQEDINQIKKAYCEGVTVATRKPVATTRTTTTTSPRTTTTTPRSTTTVRPGECKNLRIDRHCDYWKSKGYCKQTYVVFMRDNCKKSCGLCGPGQTVKPPCLDQIGSASCGNFKQRGYCVNQFASAMEKYCQKTCGKCPGSSETISTTTTQKTLTEESYVVSDEKCGIVRVMEYSQQRIIGGDRAEPGTIPWQVSIRSGKSKLPICGGTLIGKEWVLTAAHCFDKYDTDKDRYTIYLGAQHKYPYDAKDSNVISRSVSQIILHESYDRRLVRNDIALIRLSAPVAYTNYISSVCLPDSDDVQADTKVVASGFGTTKFFSENLELQKVDLFTLDNQECDLRLRTISKKDRQFITDNMMCAWVRDGRKDACQGDSGGPLTFRRHRWEPTTVVGIVSWGYGCANPLSPGVYIKVSKYRQWISERTGI